MIGDNWWQNQPEFGSEANESQAPRLRELLMDWSQTFAEQRLGTRDVEFRLGRRGVHPDEAQSFLAALDENQLKVDNAGYVSPSFCRSKPGGGRYSLFSANTYCDEPYVSLNTEYLIQLGAAAELVRSHGWPQDEAVLEVGQFDAVCIVDEQIVLAMEAKARVSGPDSLRSLLQSFINFNSKSAPPSPDDNHSRKYVELHRLTEFGPVILHLVAAGARWTLTAKRDGDRVDLEERDGPQRPATFESTAGLSYPSLPSPAVDHACAVALLTEHDSEQRTYEYPWASVDEADAFRKQLSGEIRARGLKHARAWLWQAQTSGGEPLSPSGRDTGVEVRLSYYA